MDDARKAFMATIAEGMRMPELPSGTISEQERREAIRRLMEA